MVRRRNYTNTASSTIKLPQLQRSGFCITGGLRNLFLFGEKTLFLGVVLTFVAALLVSLISGRFHFGLYGQAGAHLNLGWSFLAMALVGLAERIVVSAMGDTTDELLALARDAPVPTGAICRLESIDQPLC